MLFASKGTIPPTPASTHAGQWRCSRRRTWGSTCRTTHQATRCRCATQRPSACFHASLRSRARSLAHPCVCRQLTLALPVCATRSCGCVHVRREATDVFEPLKPKIDPSTKVTRYRAGQVPHFANGYEDDRGFVTANSQVRTALSQKAKRGIEVKSASSAASAVAPRRRFEAQVVSAKSKASDASPPRRSGGSRRGALSDDDSGSSSDDNTADALKDSSSDEDDEAFDRRRRLLRNKLAEKAQRGTDAEVAAAAPATERKVRPCAASGHCPVVSCSQASAMDVRLLT